MKLFVRTAMIFFGTLLAAGLLALGDPHGPSVVLQDSAPVAAPTSIAAPEAAWLERTANAQPGR